MLFVLSMIAALAGPAGGQGLSGPLDSVAPDDGPLRVAVLPVENMSGTPAPLREIRQLLAGALKERGIHVVDEGVLEPFLTKHRVRYAGGITAELGKALRAETGASASLITVVEQYVESSPPRIALICRLVATRERPEILWMDSVGMSGADAQGFLRLGAIDDPRRLMNNAVDRLFESLAVNGAGTPAGAKTGSRDFRPKMYYRSSALGQDLRLARVGFTRRVSRWTDRSGRASVHVSLSAASGKPVSVEYAVTAGTARAGRDYDLRPGTLVFAPGETVKEIMIDIRDRSQYDDDRTVEVSLAKPVNALLGETKVHGLVIANTHAMPSAAFGGAEQVVQEQARTVPVPVKLSAVSGKDVTVPFTVTGTAGRADYRVVTPSPVVVPAGSAGGEIVVELLDDALAEEDETVVLALGVPAGAVLGGRTVTTVRIADNDPAPAVSFTHLHSAGAETAGAARLAVGLSAASGKQVRVDYGVTGGTARGGAEYLLQPGTLVFAPGEREQAITLGVTASERYKDDATVEVSLSRPVNAVPGEVLTHTYTIQNTMPPPAVTFGDPAEHVEENIGVVTVPVRLSALSGKDTVVPFTVTGTAPGRAYRVATPSPVVIPAGRTVGEITVIVEDDRVQEEDRTIALTLGTPVHAVPGPYREHTITVTDNDRLPTVTVTPFLNASTRRNAGDLLTLHFIKHLVATGRFSIIEPGEVRQHFLDTRMVLQGGIDLGDVDIIANTLQTDLLFSGTVINYEDGGTSGDVPDIDFSVVVFERKSKRIIWASKSKGRGDDPVMLFDWGKVNVADVLASRMSRVVVDMLIQ